MSRVFLSMTDEEVCALDAAREKWNDKVTVCQISDVQ